MISINSSVQRGTVGLFYDELTTFIIVNKLERIKTGMAPGETEHGRNAKNLTIMLDENI